MMIRILIGALVATVVMASCAAEPEEGAPTTTAEDVVGDLAVPAAPADTEAEAVIPDGGGQEVLKAGAPGSTSSTPPAASGEIAAVPTEEAGSTASTDPAPEANEPTVPEESLSELPQPGGPWIDPREPDFTKTVPPPQR